MASMNGPLPPAILLGGSCNALSVARSLGRAGVKVLALNTPDSPILCSRHVTPLRPPGGGDDVAAWGDYLLGPHCEPLRGAVVLACSDAEVEYIAHNRAPLSRRYRLDLSDPEAQLSMLDKLSTYRKAEAAGVPVPRFWAPSTVEELEKLRGTLEFPLVVKPLSSHAYRQRFTRKLVVARDFEEAADAFRDARLAGLEVMLVERIPGPDDRLCSYYTYLDADGQPQLHFTKRIIRRYPALMGEGCYHVTDWIPEVRDLALRLFQAVGLRGLANAEFKLDERDGRLKLIECNARFTAANCLVTASGFDLGLFVYNRLVGRPQPPLERYRLGQRLWYPVEDFRAFQELRAMKQITLRRWLASVAHRQTLPYFRWDDPLPTLVREWRRVKQALGNRVGRMRAWFRPALPGRLRGQEIGS